MLLPAIVSPVIPFLTAAGVVLLVFLCIITFSVLTSFAIILFIYSLCNHFLRDRNWRDLESSGAGDSTAPAGTLDSRRRHPQSGELQRSIWLEVLERTMEAIEERRGRRRREAVERMPAPVRYGGEGPAPAKWRECAICLEDFERGEVCQVFPVCNHVFHYGCIHGWLRRNLTCPICRYCILEE